MKFLPANGRRIFVILIALVTLLGATNVQAAVFVGSVTGDWSDPATWGGSGPPGASDTVTINTGITVTVSDARSVTSVVLNRTTGNTTKLAMSGTGTLNVSSTITQSGSAGTATVDLTGGAGNLNLSFTGTPIGATVTLATGSSGSTVNYIGAAQTVNPVTYQNLTLSGSGAKTMTSVTTIQGNLTGSGTCTATLASGTAVSGNLSVSGATLTTANAAADLSVTGTTTVSSGTLKLGGQSSGGTYTGDFTVSGGTFDSNGGVPKLAGNFTYSSGTLTDASGASGRFWTFTGTGKTITGGTFTIPSSISVSGSVTNNATGLTISGGGTSSWLSGAGTWTQGANSSLSYGSSTPTITTFNCTANTPNTVIYTKGGVTAKATTYYNVQILPSSAGNVSLSGSTVNNNLTIGVNVNAAITFPNSPIGGTFTYSSSVSSTFPSAFSIGALNQTAGTLVVPSAQTLTVTGTGAGTFTRSAGTFTATGSTVSFTGAAPEIAGASATTFNNLTLNNSTGATLTTAPTNNGTLTLTAGAVTGNLTLANGATISLNTGSLSTAPTFGANLNVTYTGSTPATIGARNEIPLGGNLGTGLLTVNNTGGCTLDSTVGTVSSTGGAVGSGATLTVTTGGVLKNAGTFTPTGTLSFTGTGKYQHNFTTTAGAIPTATWAATSTCEIIGYTTDTSVPTGLVGQAFGNFTWNCPSQTGNINLGGTLTTVNGNFTIVNLNTATLRLASSQSTTLAIVGNLSIQQGNVEAATTTGSPTINVTGDVIISSGGILDLASGGSSGTVTLNVSGNVSVPGGATLKKTTAAQTGNITFAKSGTQTLTSGGTISGAIGWTVNSGSVLDLGASVISGSGTFNLSSGAGIITAHTSGLNGNITVSGTKTFSTGANYTYNGNSSQGTGNRLPTTVNNFTVANTGGNGANIVTLSQNLTVNGTPTISSGVLAIGGNTLTVSAPASGSFGAGGITVGTGGILAIDPSVVDGTLVDLTSVGIIAGTLKFDFASAAPSASVAPFQINADASALSASSATLTIANAGSLSFGTYPLITFASGTPSTSGFITQNLPVGGSLAISGSTINLVVSPPLTPVFSGLSSPTVIYGAASVVLTGTCKNGTRYPVNGDAITATINGHTSSSGTFDSSGNFTIAYNDASLATNGIAGSPYTIIYDYGGHSGTLTPASDGSAALTVNQRPVNLTGTRVYDGTTNAAAAILSVTNVINGDTVTVNSGTGGLAGANSGTRALTSLGDLAIAGASVGNYTLTGAGGSVTIGTAPVTPTVTANSKAYDGNTNATIATRSLTGVIGGDDVTLVGGTASFTDKNVGTGKAVNITGLGLSGTTAGNYVLNTTSTNTSADIASGTVTIVSGLSAHNKMYDGTNVATLSSNNVVLAGVLVGDEGNVTLVTNGYTASFGDINADTNKPVTVSNLTLTGGAAANYTLTQPVLAADVTPATVTVVSGLMADNKIYDTTSTATFTSNNVVLAGVVNADTNDVYLVTSGYTATFAGTNAGTSISVTVSGLALGGSAVTNNYTLTQPTLSADITQAPVTPTVTANNKVYDGTTNATIATRSLTGVIGGDDVTLVSGTASFTDKNVGTGKAVNITGLSLSGTTAGNYVLNTTATNTSADITGRTLTVGATGVNKAYDGTTNATVTLSDDRVSGDNLTIAYTAAFEDPNVGTGKPVQVTGISITGGADQNNYALGNTATQTTADITAASVSVTVSSSLNPSGFGDSVTFTATVPPDASGNVIFKANGTPLGTNLLSTGTATNLTAALLRGTNTITAEYSGDGSYLGSTNALSGGQMVTNHPPTASASTNDCTQGLSVTIQITGAGGLASDSDGDALALAATTPSLGTNYLFSAGGTNYIYYQNTNSAAGSDSFDYTVDDGYGGLATNTITINLVVPNGLSQNSLATPETIGAGPDVRLKYLGLPTYKYALEWTHDLTPTITWSALITNTAGGTGLVIYTNTPSGGRDFYRTRWVP